MIRVAFALLFGWAIVATGQVQSPSEAASQLAARISSQLPRRATVSLEVQTQVAMTSADLSTFRRALEEDLRNMGLPMTATQPETRVRITISENTRGVLLVAEIIAGDQRTVVMQPWVAPPLTEAKPRLRISRKPVWEQPEPVLDILLLNSDSDLLVLSSTTVASYRLDNNKWTQTGLATLSLARPPARDPRGRIENASGGFRVYLPGTTCSGTLRPMLTVACTPGNEAFPLDPREASFVARWVTDRNVLESPSFQSAFYAGADGWFSTPEHRIIDRAGNSLSAPDAWGSDFASVDTSCGADPTVLASGSGDSPDRDQAQAYEIASGRAASASEPMTLPGSITALWPAESAGQATLVVRNSKTGNYEASRLGVACSE
jgi:hypothetical protein